MKQNGSVVPPLLFPLSHRPPKKGCNEGLFQRSHKRVKNSYYKHSEPNLPPSVLCCSTKSLNPKDIQLTLQRFAQLESTNGWHFCLLNFSNDYQMCSPFIFWTIDSWINQLIASVLLSTLRLIHLNGLYHMNTLLVCGNNVTHLCCFCLHVQTLIPVYPPTSSSVDISSSLFPNPTFSTSLVPNQTFGEIALITYLIGHDK